ncbi:FkbM family methyltransferase [Nocardia testacea]|uniref:FkbM family methyltransferase n=1 Tax=Nocardia testacea TaxID=248551 RepID=UPI003A88DF04
MTVVDSQNPILSPIQGTERGVQRFSAHVGAVESMSSQYGQDELVLQVLNGKRGGYFLDSGASDGVAASNTFLLETSYGWSGLCVEPDPAFFEDLVSNRRCHCLNTCLFPLTDEVAFVDAGTLGGVLDDYPPEDLQYLEAACGVPPKIVRRKARSIRSVLREVDAPAVIDYWSLDVEGAELTLLKSFPFDEYTFRVLTVEHNNRPDVQASIRAFLNPLGFERLITLAIDDCYVNTRLGIATSISRSGALGRWRLGRGRDGR